MDHYLLGLLATFAAAGLLTFGLCLYMKNRREIRERWTRIRGQAIPLVVRPESSRGLKQLLLGWITFFGKLSFGEDHTKKDPSDLRLQLIQAGFRYQNAVTIFYGVKVLSALVLPLGYFLGIVWRNQISSANLGLALVIGILSYYLPNYLLLKALRSRQERLDRALPDVLDLLIVSLEAGLSLQSALVRVTDEVRRISTDMHREFQLTNAELRTGLPREMALKNLGERTGVQSVKSLIALMIQSEKMGVSIAQALRTHADFVRVQRAQRAEELAAKMPIKIIFPTLFCIFPAIFIVVLGPAAIQIYRNFLQR